MAINDPALQKKNKITKAVQKKLVNARSGLLASPDARLAARQTVAYSTSSDDEILQTLSLIDSQSKSGSFYALVDLPKNDIRKFAEYFTKKKYVVAGFLYNGNKAKVCIYWGGGKKWQKSRFGIAADAVSVGKKMAQEIVAAATEGGVTPIRWDLYNPNVTNFDKVDERRISTALYRIGNALP